MLPTRREFLEYTAGLTAGTCLAAAGTPAAAAPDPPVRRYHLSISIDALEGDPDLLKTVKEAGVHAVWLSCFYQGSWHRPIDELRKWQARAQELGLEVRHITVPLGHPSFTETPPDYMPQDASLRWPKGQRPDGRQYYGVSLHPPITDDNVKALREIAGTKPGIVFLDDDFRLAPSPDDIGGCFCPAHRDQFLQRHGLSEKDWNDLLAAVRQREFTPLVRKWVTDACDELTASFRTQQAALSPETALGIMVMYLGSEKAGIRLADYAGVPVRVGELMFDDRSFSPVKGKTNELFSALFHRRFVTPELAYSETTAWPPDGLSAPNMAAKLAVSTISDVRNTMFMSGITPFPRTHWAVLAPAMRQHAEWHRQLAGHVPRGPFKHFWGEDSRWVGDANPYSLFLALGIPFEVVSEPGPEGWVFLADADARAVTAGRLNSQGAAMLCRPSAGLDEARARNIAEELESLFAFKQEILPRIGAPHVVENVPVVCAWYPTAHSVLLWNCSESSAPLTVKFGESQRNVTLEPLGLALLPDIG